MVNVPIEHRDAIQSSYVKYRDLAKSDASVSNKAHWANSAFWIGIGLFLLWAVNLVTGAYDAGFLLGVAFTLFVIGLVTRSGALETKRKHAAETCQIEDEMREIGVLMRTRATQDGDQVVVYYQEFSEKCSFDPLIDRHYS